MGNGILGKVLYFWIFIIGGMFFARVFGVANDDRTTIMLCIGLALIYIVFQVFKYLGRNKRAERAAKREEKNRTPVRKGQPGKKKKKRL